MMTIIQPILVPDMAICNITDLYVRNNGDYKIDGEHLYIQKDSKLSFDTYFNVLSIGKWYRYTNIDQVGLKISINGKAKLIFFQLGISDEGEVKRDIISNQTIENNSDAIIWYPLEIREGVLTFEVEALSEDVDVFDMGYVAKTEKHPKDLQLAIGICTYKREEEVMNNVRSLLNDIILNPRSLLYGRMQVYIADNGQTLPIDAFDNEDIHLYPNLNYGGAGGFTRTIIEAVYNSVQNPEYIILMDDDILLDTRILDRTYRLLSVLKEDYSQSMIGGALLNREQPNTQGESGGSFDTKCNYAKTNADLNLCLVDEVIRNTKETNANFNGWFYCCIPQCVIKQQGLPLPVFIHYDDVEYGTRSPSKLITMPGISVWHPMIKGKDPLWMTYYNKRNLWIIRSVRQVDVTMIDVICDAVKVFLIGICRYRYSYTLLGLMSIKDFYSGPESFVALNPLELQKNLSSKWNYQWVHLLEMPANIQETKQSMFYVRGILNYLFPAIRKEQYVSKLIDNYDNLLVKRIWVVDTDSQKAYCLDKSYNKAWTCFISLLSTIFYIIRKHNKVWIRWNRAYDELISLSFWKKYLMINNNLW